MSNLQRPFAPCSYLFSVRLWQECMGENTVELRAEVRHVLSGELRYFREWESLTTYLTCKVHELAQAEQSTGIPLVPTLPIAGETESISPKSSRDTQTVHKNRNQGSK